MVGLLIMTLVGMGLMSTSFATSAEPTIPTFWLKSATLNGLETQPNLLGTSMSQEPLGINKGLGHPVCVDIIGTNYYPIYTYNVPAGDTLEVILPTYGYDNTALGFLGINHNTQIIHHSKTVINNTEYTIFRFKTTTNFDGLSFEYIAKGAKHGEFCTAEYGFPEPLTKFHIRFNSS